MSHAQLPAGRDNGTVDGSLNWLFGVQAFGSSEILDYGGDVSLLGPNGSVVSSEDLSPEVRRKTGVFSTDGATITILLSNVSSNVTMDEKLCDVFSLHFNYDILLLVACLLCFMIGLIYSFFGYRFFKVTLFLTGFLFGSVLIYLVCAKEEFVHVLGSAGIAVAAGLLVGLITMLVIYVGLFMTGFLAGVCIGILFLVILSAFWTPSTFWVTIGVLFGSGLILALLSLKWQRALILFDTSWIGAVLIFISIDYVVLRFKVVLQLWKVLNLTSQGTIPQCWYEWTVIASLPIVLVLGWVVQWRITAVGQEHQEDGFHTLRRYYRNRADPKPSSGNPARNGVSSVFPRDEAVHSRRHSSLSDVSANEAQLQYATKPYRQLYQARRANGDVICQSYLESLQRLASRVNPREPTTLSSEQTHLTVLTNASNSSGGTNDQPS